MSSCEVERRRVSTSGTGQAWASFKITRIRQATIKCTKANIVRVITYSYCSSVHTFIRTFMPNRPSRLARRAQRYCCRDTVAHRQRRRCCCVSFEWQVVNFTAAELTNENVQAKREPAQLNGTLKRAPARPDEGSEARPERLCHILSQRGDHIVQGKSTSPVIHTPSFIKSIVTNEYLRARDKHRDTRLIGLPLPKSLRR